MSAEPKPKPKFRSGMIVVYREWDHRRLRDDRAIKLVFRSLDYKQEPQWEDTWGNHYAENQLRPLTRRERGD